MPRLSKIGAAALAAFGWTSGSAAVTASYLVVAGGGGGGTNNSVGDGGCGGGGAGGYRTGTEALNLTQSYSVVVGAGGARGAADAAGSNGSNSVFLTTTSAGGGGGGDSQNGVKRAGDGGSGGGAGYINSAAGSGNTPSTSPSQGNNGGSYSSGDHGAGGGGATDAGSNTAGSPGAGGAGTLNSISGSSVTYAGGGGGGGYNTTGALGGSGGGGQGGSNGAAGISGTANLGGGGGGGGGGSSPPTVGGNGGSGVVIISYVGAQQFGGGVVTSSGGNTIHTFNTSGTLSPLSSLTANFLVIAGGGGGGGFNNGGGGGAGGLLSGSGVTIDTNSIYAVTVGAGGVGGSTSTGRGTNGTNSSFSMVSTAAVGGGGGGGFDGGSGGLPGFSGGSGGGGGALNAAGGAGTSGQGNAGGTAASNSAGGGGGAGSVGGNASGSNPNGVGGNGGTGTSSSISGTSTFYASGGGGSAQSSGTQGTASAGGGGNGGTTGVSGTANTGGGGGGTYNTGAGGTGGSGVVIISYAGSTQQMAGGTVTVAGGNVIHTFTSSGYLTPIITVNNSLRFRSSASAYLNRTPSVASNRTTWTWSGWVKLGSLSVSRQFFGTTGGSTQDALVFNADNQLVVFSDNASQTLLRTAQLFRDPSAWYHIVVAVDTTQATSSNRVKIYVNGVQVTAFEYTQYPSPSFQGSINNNVIHYISTYDGSNWAFDGYMADINFVDGQALTPNSFGTSNGLGVWQPIRYGGSYGTNGFYLPFNAGTSTFIGSYNGSTAWFNAANNAAFAFGTGSLTIEAWVYPTQNSYGAIFDTRSTGSGGPGVSIYANSGNGIILVNNTTYNPSTYLSLNQWSHIAAVRNGASSWTVYINGNSVLTFTDSSNLTDNACFSGKNYAGNFWFGGFISNLRVVKGTAVYTSNFTPATSPLTNISGTSLLTLQNSTLIDNSTNAFSLTNTGPITTLGAYIFTVINGTFKDNSPQGNNWTYNNISTAFGSSCDLMTDVPTLTSATTANYCVMNPLDKNTSATISNGNLTQDASASTWRAVRSTYFVSSGKWYWETTLSGSGSDTGMIGISNASATLANIPDANGYGYNGTNGQKYTNSTNAAYGASFASGDVIGIALDMDAGTLTFYKNNASQGTAFTGLSGLFSPTFWQYAGYTWNTNFGQRPFAYTPPTGFVALNTFNLSTPDIGATASTTANKYFDATLYTGNSSTQTVTNSGSMQPDFIWVKSRTYGSSHGLVDSVRGLASGLNSNATSSQTTLTDSITSINSNGFSLGADSTTWFNYGGSYVAWQWRASNATAVTNTAGSIISTVSANTTAGFSIVTYTGNATSGATVGHGCQVGGIATAPSMVILKSRSLGTNWYVYHSGLTSAAYQVYLNLTSGEDNSVTTAFNSVAPGATTFTLPGTGFGSNNSSATYVAYCFAPVAGYSAFGTYTGNGDPNGPFIYTGFRPKFLILKRTNPGVADAWIMADTSIQPYNVVGNFLQPSQPDQELYAVMYDLLSNGFKLRETYTTINTSGGTYIYMAFAENPFKYANAK